MVLIFYDSIFVFINYNILILYDYRYYRDFNLCIQYRYPYNGDVRICYQCPNTDTLCYNTDTLYTTI